MRRSTHQPLSVPLQPPGFLSQSPTLVFSFAVKARPAPTPLTPSANPPHPSPICRTVTFCQPTTKHTITTPPPSCENNGKSTGNDESNASSGRTRAVFTHPSSSTTSVSSPGMMTLTPGPPDVWHPLAGQVSASSKHTPQHQITYKPCSPPRTRRWNHQTSWFQKLCVFRSCTLCVWGSAWRLGRPRPAARPPGASSGMYTTHRGRGSRSSPAPPPPPPLWGGQSSKWPSGRAAHEPKVRAREGSRSRYLTP